MTNHSVDVPSYLSAYIRRAKTWVGENAELRYVHAVPLAAIGPKSRVIAQAWLNRIMLLRNMHIEYSIEWRQGLPLTSDAIKFLGSCEKAGVDGKLLGWEK